MTKIPLRDYKCVYLLKFNEFHDEVVIIFSDGDRIYHGDDTKKNASTFQFLVQ